MQVAPGQKALRSIPEGRKALVSDNGAYVLLVDGTGYAYEASSQSVELLDAQGTLLWEARLAPDAFLSPTGEMVVSLNIEASKDIPFSFWGPQGKLAEYESVVGRASFSADGQHLFVRESVRDTSLSDCVSLFDKQGQRLWQRHCRPYGEHPINKVFISESGRFMAFTYYRKSSWNPGSEPPPPPVPRYLAVLDQNGDMLWTRSHTGVWHLTFSEEDELIATLQRGERESAQEPEIIVANVRTGDTQQRFAVALPEKSIRGYPRLSFLQNQNLLLRYYQRIPRDILAHLQLFDSTGVLSWESIFNPNTEEWDGSGTNPAWLEKGPLLGIMMGRVFQLLDLSPHDSSEE